MKFYCRVETETGKPILAIINAANQEKAEYALKKRLEEEFNRTDIQFQPWPSRSEAVQKGPEK